MIFATCGSTPFGFERMMQALSALPADDLIVQHGPTPPPPCAHAYDFLPFGAIIELMRDADTVVSHAGVGSIMCALQAGHRPIVFPRLKRYGDGIDDHQAELANALQERGTVIVATSGEELLAAAAAPPQRRAQRTLTGAELNVAVHAALHGESARSLRSASRRRPAPTLSGSEHASRTDAMASVDAHASPLNLIV